MERKAALERAIKLTDDILEMLEAGDFERVNKLESERKPYIDQAFAGSVEAIDLIRAHHLQNLNQQVVDKLTLFRQSIQLEQARARSASRAARAYRSVDSVPK